jgi:hypothetical protein
MIARMGVRTMVMVAAACAALGAGFALGRLAPRAAPPYNATPGDTAAAVAQPSAPAVPRAEDGLAGLRACVRKLGEAEARIERGCVPLAAAAPLPIATADQGASPAATPGAPTAGAGAPVDAAPSAAARAFSQGFMVHVVGTTDTESRWLQEYACLLDDRRRRTERDLGTIFADPARASDRAAIDAVVADSKAERDAMLADIEARLGKDRYKRMRDLGGLGILSKSCLPR